MSREWVRLYFQGFLVSTLSACFLFAQSSPEVSFDKNILPIFQKECLGCHSSDLKMGGLVLESYRDLMKGGDHGLAIVSGHSDQSLLVRMLEGKAEPRMPLNGELTPNQINMVRVWVDASDQLPDVPEVAIGQVPIPEIHPWFKVDPPVAALAFHPKGKLLAKGGFCTVDLMTLGKDTMTRTLKGPEDLVRSLNFSQDGKLLAAGGGVPAREGEIWIWNVEENILKEKWKGHSDCVYSLAFSPDNRFLASSSYDRLIQLWEVQTGTVLKKMEEHNGPVFSVAFLPPGDKLISASGDGTVKVWQIPSGQLLFTLSGAKGPLYDLAIHPFGEELAAIGEDGTIRIWVWVEEYWEIRRSVIAHRMGGQHIVYSADGQRLITSGIDRLVKIWDSISLKQLRVRDPEPDSIMSLALAADGLLAMGRYDGSLRLVPNILE